MKQLKTVGYLVIVIVIAAGAASILGISDSGGSAYSHQSIREETVEIYGRGIYRHMSTEVAIQGIAQDYITLFGAIPLLILSYILAARGSLRGKYVLAGSLGYFLVTYLIYLMMAMYNQLFLVYALLTGTAFFALLLTFASFDPDKLSLSARAPMKVAGIFLVFNAAAMALLWLGVVLPPLLDGSLYPPAVEHYTTLVVQGIDLALLLPLGAVAGLLMLRRHAAGYLAGPVYLVFLSLIMTALMAKIIFMGMQGFSIIPVIFVIPLILILAITLSVLTLRGAG